MLVVDRICLFVSSVIDLFGLLRGLGSVGLPLRQGVRIWWDLGFSLVEFGLFYRWA